MIRNHEDLLNQPWLNVKISAWILAQHLRECGISWNFLGSYNAGFHPRNEKKRLRYAQQIYVHYWPDYKRRQEKTVSAVSLVLLGLCAVIVQSGVVVVARHFLDVHHERPLLAIGRNVIATHVIFTGLSFLSAMFAISALQGLFALVFLAFLSLFIYLDAASRCFPRCFTWRLG